MKLSVKDKTFYVVVFILVIVLALYFIQFHSGFSNNQSDWGFFGGYLSGVIGIVSIVLLYTTYREQRKTNHRDLCLGLLKFRIEQIIRFEKDLSDCLSVLYEKVMIPFSIDFETEEEDGQPYWQTFGVISYIFTGNNLLNEAKDSCERFYAAIRHAIDSVDTDDMLSDKERQDYVSEILWPLSEEAHTLFYFHTVTNADPNFIHMCIRYNVFSNLFSDCKILKFSLRHLTEISPSSNSGENTDVENFKLADGVIKDPWLDIKNKLYFRLNS